MLATCQICLQLLGGSVSLDPSVILWFLADGRPEWMVATPSQPPGSDEAELRHGKFGVVRSLLRALERGQVRGVKFWISG